MFQAEDSIKALNIHIFHTFVAHFKTLIMVTIDQIKELTERTNALGRYL